MKERLESVLARDVSRETLDRLEVYESLLCDEATRQNLVSRGTLDHFWDRHILDSAQLLRFNPRPGASWVDIGSGAGLPGIVLAILTDGPVTLVDAIITDSAIKTEDKTRFEDAGIEVLIA